MRRVRVMVVGALLVLPVIVVRIWAPGRQAELVDRLSCAREIVASLPPEGPATFRVVSCQ